MWRVPAGGARKKRKAAVTIERKRRERRYRKITHIYALRGYVARYLLVRPTHKMPHNSHNFVFYRVKSKK